MNPDTLRDALRRRLNAALKQRDRTAVSALRSLLGAIDNAESVESQPGPRLPKGPIAGASVGLGSSEMARRLLTESDLVAIIDAEITERIQAAEQYDAAGRGEHANHLRAEADVIQRFRSELD